MRDQTVPTTSLEHPRSGRFSMINFISTWPFSWGGCLRMVEGLLGIQPYQSNWNINSHILAYRYYPEFCLGILKALVDDMKVHNLTCPKLTAACCAEAVKITTVRYSTNCSRDSRDLGKPVNSSSMHLSCAHIYIYSFYRRFYTKRLAIKVT